MIDPVPLAEKVARLRTPGAYPERPRAVDCIETNLSYVFLLERDVYKLKKPAVRPFLDFSTPERRHANAEAEVRLNRRLAPEVYLGVVPLARDASGQLAVGGPGEAVDWLVHMRRLPADRMLDRALVAGTATRDDADRVGNVLATFFATSSSGGASRAPLSPGEYVALLASDVRREVSDLTRPELGLVPARIEAIGRALDDFIARARPLLEERVREGRVVEGHGDLRPEHVALGPAPVVIDCLEFKASFRLLDPIDELAFLRLECSLLGHAWFADAVIASYERASGDRAPAELLAFHESRRAFLRAKLAIWHVLAPKRDGTDWRARTEEYLARAEASARVALGS